jgi:hypothetical protein
MQYIEPVGAQGPANAFGHDYVDKNAGAGIAGSFLAADVPEHLQIEILNAIAAAGLTPNGSDLTQLAAALGRRVKNTIIQQVAGTYIWTKPAWCKAVEIEIVSGGGGGAGATSNPGNACFPGGGAGGGWLKKFMLASALGATETYIVGAGGAGVAYVGSGGKTGGDGGSSSFGSYASVTGGQGGYDMSVGTTQVATSGSAGGIPTGGDVQMRGGNGDAGYRYGPVYGRCGDGGSSMYAPRIPGFNLSQAGGSGQSPGQGGTAAASFDNNGTFLGGSGKAGMIIIREML